jgi:hypothetical protein
MLAWCGMGSTHRSPSGAQWACAGRLVETSFSLPLQMDCTVPIWRGTDGACIPISNSAAYRVCQLCVRDPHRDICQCPGSRLFLPDVARGGCCEGLQREGRMVRTRASLAPRRVCARRHAVHTPHAGGQTCLTCRLVIRRTSLAHGQRSLHGHACGQSVLRGEGVRVRLSSARGTPHPWEHSTALRANVGRARAEEYKCGAMIGPKGLPLPVWCATLASYQPCAPRCIHPALLARFAATLPPQPSLHSQPTAPTSGAVAGPLLVTLSGALTAGLRAPHHLCLHRKPEYLQQARKASTDRARMLAECSTTGDTWDDTHVSHARTHRSTGS